MDLGDIVEELERAGLTRISLEQVNAQRQFFLPESAPFTKEDMPCWLTFNYKAFRVCVEVSEDKCFNLPGKPEEETYHTIHVAVSGLDALYQDENTETIKRTFAQHLKTEFELPWAEFENGDISTTATDAETLQQFLACTKSLVDTVTSQEYSSILCKDKYTHDRTDEQLRELARRAKAKYNLAISETN